MGDMTRWLVDNWFFLLSAVGIGSGIWYNAGALRSEANSRKIANVLAITANHREIWTQFINNPNLKRIRDAAADTIAQPVNDIEQVFVTLVIVHASNVYFALNDQLVVRYDGLRRDLAEFFSLPVPNAVWQKTKLLQNQDFAAFIDSSLK
jgi:hypothetical protein